MSRAEHPASPLDLDLPSTPAATLPCGPHPWRDPIPDRARRRARRGDAGRRVRRPPASTLLFLAIALLFAVSANIAVAEENAGGHINATATAAKPRMARLGVFANPASATIYVDGRMMGQGKFVGYVPEGIHVVRFELEGHNTVEEQLTLSADDGPGYLVVHLRPTARPSVELVGRHGGVVDQFDHDIAAWSLTGAGSLMLIGGIVMLAIDGQPACSGPASECPKLFETTGGGVALTTLGSIALTSGVIFFFWDQLAGYKPSTSTVDPWQVGLGPLGEDPASPEGGAVWVQGRW